MIASAVSLVLSIAAVVQWARSHGHYDQLRLTCFGRLWVVETCHGQLSVATMVGWPVNETVRLRSIATDEPPQGLPLFSIGTDPAQSHGWESSTAWLMFREGYGVGRATYMADAKLPPVGNWPRFRDDGSPVTPLLPYSQRDFYLGGIIPLFMVLPASRLLVAIARDLLRPTPQGNRCVQCGYNLTGNTSGICPECGAAVVRSIGANSPSP